MTMWVMLYSLTKRGNRADHVAPLERHGHAAELLGQRQRIADLPLGGRVDPVDGFARRLNVDGIPGRIEPVGHAGPLAQQRLGAGAARAETDHDAVRGRRSPLALLLVSAAVEAMGDLVQGQLAQQRSGWPA